MDLAGGMPCGDAHPLLKGRNVFTLIGRWLLRALLVLAASFVVAFIGDWSLYHLRGSPASTVNINRYMGIPLKGQKEEFDFLGTVAMPCSRSLFPQSGLDPCWYMRRNPNQWQNL